MRRKRLNHHVDIFCEMFSGWRLANDMDTLIELEEGHFELDFIKKSAKLNNKPYDKAFHMLFEIATWFDKELTDNKIDKELIGKANLYVDFFATETDGKPKSRTKKIVVIKLKMKGVILTDEKEYLANKEQILEFHSIVPKSKHKLD